MEHKRSDEHGRHAVIAEVGFGAAVIDLVVHLPGVVCLCWNSLETVTCCGSRAGIVDLKLVAREGKAASFSVEAFSNAFIWVHVIMYLCRHVRVYI